MIRTLGLALAALTLFGCDQPPDTEFDLLTERELELKVEALDKKVDALSAKADGGGAAPSAADQARQAKERAAFEKWKEMMDARANGDLDAVRKHIAEIERDFADTRAIAEIQGVKQELEVLGKDAVPLDAEKWFVGQTSMDQGKATVLVFWEVWCPHCQREVPKLQQTFDKYSGQGLNMVGVTQVTNGKTDDDVMAFINEQNITYPIAKTGNAVPGHYNVQGIPAAAVVKDGKVVWRGHPGLIDDAMIEGWLGS